jgi:glucokinase
MDWYIAVDIGGTHIRVAIYQDDAIQPSQQKRITTKGKGSPLERTLNLIAELWPAEGTVRAIAAAAPGPINPETGVIFKAPNIPGWVNLPLGDSIKDHFHVPVSIGNDANLAALGEWRYGAGRGHHNVFYMTISTGIGGGIIVNDQLLLGHLGLAGEIGHVTIDPNGPICGCSQRGHIEAIASGPAIARYVSERLKQGAASTLSTVPSFTTKEISAAAYQGDSLALEAFAMAGRYLGIALANYVHIFNPSMIILGGGVVQCGDVLLDPMKKSLKEHVLSPEYLEGLNIVEAELGDNAGLMGALALAHSITH